MNAPLLDRRNAEARGGTAGSAFAAASLTPDSIAPAEEGQSPASADPVHAVFASCLEMFRTGLREEGLRPAVLPAEWAAAEARGGRFLLRAFAWRKEAGLQGAVEGRAAAVRGPNCEIITCLIFPERNDRQPVFATELVAQGGVPRVAFLDLQTPGLEEGRRVQVAEAAREALETFPEAERDEAPDWARRDGSGFHLFSRGSGGVAGLPRWQEAFSAYLRGWRRIWSLDDPSPQDPSRGGAFGGCDGESSTAASRDAAKNYKAGHVSHSPGTPFLRTVFGAAWTDRFLEEFLYG